MESIIVEDNNYKMFMKYKSSQNEEDFNELFNANIRLAYFIYKRYFRSLNLSDDEIYSYGGVAIYNAVNSFDPSKGVKFSSFASKCIYNAFLTHIKTEKRRVDSISLETPISEFDGVELTLKDVIKDDSESSSDIYENKELGEILLYSFNSLSPRAKEIMCMRYGIGTKEKSMSQIASELNVTRSYVGMVIKSSLIRLKRVIKIDEEGYILAVRTTRTFDYNEMNEQEKRSAEEQMIRLHMGYPYGQGKNCAAIGKIFRISPSLVKTIINDSINKEREEFNRRLLMKQ